MGCRGSAPRMTRRRSHWTERGDDITFFLHLAPLWCACSFSGCEWAYCHGTLLHEFSITKCRGVLGGDDQNRAEKQNVVLTWFRPVTWSEPGDLGRREVGKNTRNHSTPYSNFTWKGFDSLAFMIAFLHQSPPKTIASTVSGPERGVITKGVFSLEESLESLKSLDSLESLENGRILLYFPESGGPLESLNSLESLENGLF